ncbi:MAG: phospholipase [Planctomycetaceae bacterium]|nr:phospholipase [Planctomycetaceae bacterium]
MSVSAAALRELHRILRQLSDLRSRLERGPRQVRLGEDNVKRLEAIVAEAKDTVQKAKMSADDKELQLRERENRIADVKTKLNSCSSNREYQAFVEQIAADEQANSVLSDEILEMFEKISELQEVVTSSQGDLEKGKTELGAIRGRVDDERASLEGDVARLSNELQEAEAQLPGDLKLDYQRIVKARGEDGLAPLDGECCGGCYTKITMQTFDELRLSKPVFCKSCGCLLYLPEDRDVTA